MWNLGNTTFSLHQAFSPPPSTSMSAIAEATPANSATAEATPANSATAEATPANSATQYQSKCVYTSHVD